MMDEEGYWNGGDMHRLTEYPVSLSEMKPLTLDEIERALHAKVEGLTRRDEDRFRPILKLWRTYSSCYNPEDDVASVDKANFREILELLGLFPTQDQSDILFDKYDIDGDGNLTVHEFMTRCRPKDFGNTRTYFKADPAGKRVFMERKYTGDYIRPVTPDHYGFNLQFLKDGIATKIEKNTPITQTHSGPRARRELALFFERFDHERNRYVNMTGLRRVFAEINFPMHDSHYEKLMGHFPANPKYGETEALFDYPKFVLYVYPPEEQPISLSIFLDSEKDVLRDAYAHQTWIQNDLMKDRDLKFLEPQINAARERLADIYGTDYIPVQGYVGEEEEENTRRLTPLSRMPTPGRRPSTVNSAASRPKSFLPPAHTSRPQTPSVAPARAQTPAYRLKTPSSFRPPNSQTARPPSRSGLSLRASQDLLARNPKLKAIKEMERKRARRRAQTSHSRSKPGWR